MKKTLAASLILALFIYGVGFYGSDPHALLPSLRLLRDTQWNFSLFGAQGAEKLLALFILILVGVGFIGWMVFLKAVLFPRIEDGIAELLGLALGLTFFSLYVFGLSINEILYGPLVFLFFIPTLRKGWLECRKISFPWKKLRKDKWRFFLVLPLLLWMAEYFSAPLVWDAVLDHFRYAREVSRLHQLLFHWTNHTGDMPKAAELVLAGFWAMGGESLSKLSAVIPAILTAWLLSLFSSEGKTSGGVAGWIFWTCPFFLAIFSWGYVEGFLAFYEVLALYCLWKAIVQPGKWVWLPLAAFFSGFAFSIKYTALLAIAVLGLIWIYWRFVQKANLKMSWGLLACFTVPVFPWLLKNVLAYGNPFYPLATSVFGTSVGYGSGMERDLWQDTGLPQGLGVWDHIVLLWRVFFTPQNAVAACWTPLVFMSLPWSWKALKNRLGFFLLLFTALFFMGWIFFCTSLRHASGGTLALVLLAVMAWGEALKEKKARSRAVFAVGVLLSVWLCLSAQLTTTAPYASALGLEDPLLRLKRHYTYDTDTYAAYRFIEDHSESKDKVMAFAVFQTYPLERIAYVDFKWKRPIFLQWASQCQTAEQLARKCHEEGVRYFLYQQWEAAAMSRVEKNFDLEGMPAQEYIRFWQYYMEPVEVGDNSYVYQVRTAPLERPRKLHLLPGLQEKGFWRPA